MPDDRMTEDEFESVIRSDDPFTVAVRGHQAIDELLNLALSESLVEPHALEVKRLGFPLKTDLVIALGVVPQDARSVMKQVNGARNKFAHDRRAEFGEKEATDMLNAWSAEMRSTFAEAVESWTVPIETLRDSLAILFIRLEGRITRIRDQKAENRILAELVGEVAGRRPADRTKPPSERLAERLQADREKRRAQGEL